MLHIPFKQYNFPSSLQSAMRGMYTSEHQSQKVRESSGYDITKCPQQKRRMSSSEEVKQKSRHAAPSPSLNTKMSKPAEPDELEEKWDAKAQERAESKDQKNGLKLPSIQLRKYVNCFEKENDVKMEESIYKVEGKKLNLESFNEAKIRIAETAKAEGFDALKYINIRPLRIEQSPSKKRDLSTKLVMKNKGKGKVQAEKDQREEKILDDGDAKSSPDDTPNARFDKSPFHHQQIRKLPTGDRKQKPKRQYLQVKRDIGEQIQKRRQGKSNTTILTLTKRKYSVNYLDWCLFISLLNKVGELPQCLGNYKAYVGKGNNSVLIKTMIKNRFWWNISDNETDANLYWQQQRENKFIASLKSYETSKHMEETFRSRFLLEKPKDKDIQKADPVRSFNRSGFWKLMSARERQTYSKYSYAVELSNECCHELECANKIRMHNHFEFNWNITNKKALYYNLRSFYTAMKEDPFQYIPLTFHVQQEGDEQWNRFEKYYVQREETLRAKNDGKTKKKKEKNLWIVKPGENSNQGCGIQVAETLDEIKEIIRSKQSNKKRSHIIQRYLLPLLYNKRKFDIRCYVLVTSVGGTLRAYWYEEGYIRTSSKQFSLKNLKNRFIHLTNDAVQKKSQDYGKYENGNKVSFNDFQKYLENAFPDKTYDFFIDVYPKMMKLAADSIRSVCSVLDSNKRQFTFEVFGLDFMIDEDFSTWLIEVNNNPCLELGCPLLARVIPSMIEGALRIAVDPFFPPPREYAKNKVMPNELFQANKFTLIFDSSEESAVLGTFTLNSKANNLSNIVESDEQQENHDD